MIDIVKQIEDVIKIQKMISSSSSHKYKYMSGYDFVLKNGVKCIPQPYDASKYAGVPRTKKECFRNAYYLSLYEGLIYVEGLGFNNLITEHAWCVDEDMNVYDPTWDEPETREYYGVLFNMDYVEKIARESEVWGVIQNYKGRFPLLTGEHTDFKHKFESNESKRN